MERFTIGEWTIEPDLDLVRRSGVEHRVSPRAMNVMTALVRRRGSVVSTETILEEIARGTIMSDNAVHKAIAEVRKALEDHPKHPRYIETVPHGYRLIAPVSEAAGAAADDHRPVERPDRGGAKPLVAVLPLENLSGDPEQEYVADGMTEELTGELSKLSGIDVISRTSVMHYKGGARPIPTIAAELGGVDWIIEGAVAREESRFRVRVQLVDVRRDTPVWSERYEREQASVMALHEDVARAVAAQLPIAITDRKKYALAAEFRVKPEAYDAYLRGLDHRHGGLEDAIRWAPARIADYEAAVAIDPTFTRAWVALAHARLGAAVLDPDAYYPLAKEAAERAIALDPEAGAAHALLGRRGMAQYFDLQPETVRAHIEQAMRLTPDEPDSLVAYGEWLYAQERYEEVMPVTSRLLRVAPQDQLYRWYRINIFLEARLYERAIEDGNRVRKLWPDFGSIWEFNAYHQLGRFEDAWHFLRAWVERMSDNKEVLLAFDRGWTEGGYEGLFRARAVHSAIEPWFSICQIHAALGEMDRAFEWLERFVDTGNPLLLAALPFMHSFDILRPDPRFDAILARMGLKAPQPEHPARMGEVGRVMAFRGQAAEAVSRLERAIAQSPNDERLPRWQESLAYAHLALGDYDRTVSLTRQTLQHELGPHAKAFAHLLLAASYAQIGRTDNAKREVEHAVELRPRLDVDRDLLPLFMGGDADMRDRYMTGLHKAGLGR
jgi:TolB-like protein/Tfp pilus assembly protein PilF